MSTDLEAEDEVSVLQSKRNATRYQILVQIAERQPAVSQQEIADAIGVTAQAVSDYLQDLVEMGYVQKHGRGRYEVTKEGVDWLISQTDDLRDFIEHVAEDVIGQVEIDTAIATADINEGQSVSLTMQEGVLHATPGGTGEATAVAVTSAEAGREVGVTDFEGIVDYEFGKVTIISIPPVQEGGSQIIDIDLVVENEETHDLLAVAGTEALAAVRAAELDPDIRFGTSAGVQEAATKGLDVLVLAVTTELSALTERLREQNISHEIIEPNIA